MVNENTPKDRKREKERYKDSMCVCAHLWVKKQGRGFVVPKQNKNIPMQISKIFKIFKYSKQIQVFIKYL